MPRDRRLYMTFPIDFPDHPKVLPLSALAKWSFVEMNAYSRRLGLDGRIPIATARVKWSRKVLADLVASDPDRPLVMLEPDAYVIRDYSEHQFTTDDLEELHDKRARAGSLGGTAAAKAKQTGSKPLASAVANGQQNAAGLRSESESGSELLDTHISGPVLQTPGSYPQGPDDVESVEELCVRQSARMGVDYGKVRAAITKACGRFPAPHGVMVIIATVLERAKPPIKSPTGVVLAAVRNDWPEFQQYLDVVAS